jgi:hypothetical protein
MSGEPLTPIIELLLCIFAASILNNLRNARQATAANRSRSKRIVEPGRRLPSADSMPYGLCEARSPVRESSVPTRRPRILL